MADRKLVGAPLQVFQASKRRRTQECREIRCTPLSALPAFQILISSAKLKWSVRDLAAKSGITANTISRIENGSDAKASTLNAIRTALEEGGVKFIEKNGGGVGVRSAKKHVKSTLHLDDATAAKLRREGLVSASDYRKRAAGGTSGRAAAAAMAVRRVMGFDSGMSVMVRPALTMHLHRSHVVC